jgi:ABC-2 type transport system permease protein
MRGYIDWSFVPGQAIWIAMSLFFGAIIFALIQATIGILAFWVTEIWPFAEMMDVTLHLFGGMLAPIALLPQAVQRVTVWLPFRYIFFEPINIILGNQSDPMSVIYKQGIFIVVLYLLHVVVWKAGIRRYEGIGG